MPQRTSSTRSEERSIPKGTSTSELIPPIARVKDVLYGSYPPSNLDWMESVRKQPIITISKPVAATVVDEVREQSAELASPPVEWVVAEVGHGSS